MTDIYTEPEDFDLDTQRNLGPLAVLAGTWEGGGTDVHPVAGGPEDEAYKETMVFEPIDPQTNGPQLLYGLRYHQHVNKLDEPLTFHDQVGYWLWEPATKTLMQTVAIPRGQVALAAGSAEPNAKSFTVKSKLDDPCYGLCSAPFLAKNFKTLEYSITITVNPDGTIGYQQDMLLVMPGREPFHHTDKATLKKIAEAKPNPVSPRAS